MDKEPIKSQKEAHEVFKYLVETTMNVTRCDREQSEKRVTSLLKSGILKGGSPNYINTKKKIDDFMFTQID